VTDADFAISITYGVPAFIAAQVTVIALLRNQARQRAGAPGVDAPVRLQPTITGTR
jgi:hypothetical protein